MSNRKGQRRRTQRQRALLKRGGFTLLDSLMASADRPTSAARKTDMLLHMHSALDAIMTTGQPSVEHWRSLADAVNLCQALVSLGWASDPEGVIDQAVIQMAQAAERYGAGEPIRLSGAGVTAVRQALATWEEAMDALSERQVLHAKKYAVKTIYEAICEGADNGTKVVEIVK